MSEGEFIVFAGSLVWSGYTWFHWYLRLLRVPVATGGYTARTIMAVTPALCLGLLLSILIRFAAHDVRPSVFYTIFYLALGSAWLATMVRLMPLLNLSPQDDAVERGNQAAAWTDAGAMLGLTLAFAGANIGDGPGWWVVLFSAGVSSAAWFLAWAGWEWLTRTSHAITVDRDESTGLRSAGIAIGFGLLTGRAAAGNWISASATVADFVRDSWPLLSLLLIAGLADRLLGIRGVGEYRPPIIYGWGPAILYVGAACVGLLALGWWS